MPGPTVVVPDGTDPDDALARTTDLGIGGHPDDLELVLFPAISHCFEDPDRWFTGVVCTDGGGSPRGGRFAGLSDADLVAERRREMVTAAHLGGYGALVPLDHPSAEVRSEAGHAVLVKELSRLIAATQPAHVYTHDLADRHETHVAVAAAVVRAVRSLPPEQRPWRLVGCEGWRGLDWLSEGARVVIDVSDHAALADQLAKVFASQIEGAKRYDLAAAGRRRAHATFQDPRSPDVASQVVVARS